MLFAVSKCPLRLNEYMDESFKTSSVSVTLIPVHHDAAGVHRNTIRLLSSSLTDLNLQHFERINLHATNVFNRSQKCKPVIMSLRFRRLGGNFVRNRSPALVDIQVRILRF